MRCTLIAYTYNQDGQIAFIKDVTGKTTYYSYDILGRIDELTDDSGTIVAKYSYLPNNLIESITYGNGIKTTYSYDSDQNISHLLTVTPEGEKLQDFSYQYDLNGNRLSKVGLNQDTHFAYDNMNRLIKANYNERTESFTYDLVGNRLSHTVNDESTTFIYNTKNQLTQLSKDLGITNFTYDAQDNILKESTPQGTNSFSYNALNQQRKVVTYQGNTLINHYDAEGLRAEIEENQKLARFIFHRDEILVETDENDRAVSRLVRGYNVIAGDILSETYYYQLDEQFSTSLITNQAQKVVNSYTYDAFGNTLECQEQVHNRIRYTGQQYDAITQQYYLRARFYNPILGRFMQEDVYRGDGLNLYAYCSNNPVTYYDPSGYSHDKNKEAEPQTNSKGGNNSTATQMRNSPGVVEGHGKNVNKMMHGSDNNAGVVPKEVADKLRGKQYDNFDDFRKDFWKSVADTDYAKEFLINGDPKNYYRMKNGGAPLVSSNQAINGSYTYQIHHSIPINQGGKVYSLDNLVVVTPRYHAEILIPEIHGYNGLKKYFR